MGVNCGRGTGRQSVADSRGKRSLRKPSPSVRQAGGPNTASDRSRQLLARQTSEISFIDSPSAI
jgi:hypothetical protein